ncbi:hypothetical protein [Thermomonas fusca]|uniref:hypothetical protein n=1 Tax=Thermomonas fusca TaxID=215690 RepID=UPI001FE88F5B|nr:hypothetical protein [Thermomonas fusca]
MTSRSDLDARLDAIAAQMPRFRQDMQRVFADIDRRDDQPCPEAEPAANPRQQPDARPATTVDRAALH